MDFGSRDDLMVYTLTEISRKAKEALLPGVKADDKLTEIDELATEALRTLPKPPKV